MLLSALWHVIPVVLYLSRLSLAQYVTAPCPLLGADVPVPTRLSNSRAVESAKQAIAVAIEESLLNATKYGQLDPNSTSFSLEIYSLHEPDSVFTYHYSAPDLAEPSEGVSVVDSNTIYRIGSISKLLTVYLYLIEAGDVSFNQPVTNFVPELARYSTEKADLLEADTVDIVDWSEITIGALASHMAGIGRDYAGRDTLDAIYGEIGLPPVPPVNGSFCGGVPCDRTGKMTSVYAPWIHEY